MAITFQNIQGIQVDDDKQEIIIAGHLNGDYLDQPTRHLAVNPSGSEGGKCLVDAEVSPDEFYEALKTIGAKPGENMAYETAQDQHVEGTPLAISLVWEGADRAYSIDEVLEDSNGKPFDFRFAGNIEVSREKGTGCLICLDSCYISPASNANYTFGAINKRQEVTFPAQKDILPEVGSPVELVVRVKSE